MILPADVDSKTWSGKGLYNAVWCHVARLVSPVPKQMAQINHALDGYNGYDVAERINAFYNNFCNCSVMKTCTANIRTN